MSLLTPVCKSVACSDMLERMATAEQREQGLDIADFLLMTETKQMLLAQMMRRNPALKQLVECFDLQIVED